MEEKLKPCPFCGGTNLKFRFAKGCGDFHEYAYGAVICLNKDCGALTEWTLLDADEWDEKSAEKFCSERWNRRVNE